MACGDERLQVGISGGRLGCVMTSDYSDGSDNDRWNV